MATSSDPPVASTADDLTKELGGEPAKEPARPRARPTSRSRAFQAETVREQLYQQFGFVAVFVGMRCQQCGLHVAQNHRAFVDSLVELAKTNKNVRQMLEAMLEAGSWGAVIASSANLTIPIVQHHSRRFREQISPEHVENGHESHPTYVEGTSIPDVE